MRKSLLKSKRRKPTNIKQYMEEKSRTQEASSEAKTRRRKTDN